jgi:hypothetical protein
MQIGAYNLSFMFQVLVIHDKCVVMLNNENYFNQLFVLLLNKSAATHTQNS